MLRPKVRNDSKKPTKVLRLSGGIGAILCALLLMIAFGLRELSVPGALAFACAALFLGLAWWQLRLRWRIEIREDSIQCFDLRGRMYQEFLREDVLGVTLDPDRTGDKYYHVQTKQGRRVLPVHSDGFPILRKRLEEWGVENAPS